MNISNIDWNKVKESVEKINSVIDAGMKNRIDLPGVTIYSIGSNVIRIDIKS